MNTLYSRFLIFVFLIFCSKNFIQAQNCPTIDAQAGTGASTTICAGQCANLTASVIPVNNTGSYSVAATSYSPFPFTGGTTVIGTVDDVWSPAVNIGFNFCYFGNTFNQLSIGSNGEVTFDLSVAGGPENFLINSILPNITDHPGNTICPAFRDIDPSSGATSNIAYYTTGTAPCRKFVVYWQNVPLFQCNTPESSFQLVLHETTNIIEFFVENSTSCPIWQSGKGIMGIQNGTGTTAVAPPGRNVLTAWSAVNEAWRFVPTGAAAYTINWSGPSGFSASGLTATVCPTATGNYTATMNVTNCDNTITTYSSAVQVSVTPSPTLATTATPTAICRGESAVLSTSGASTYTWSPGSSNSFSISVTPTVTTTYTVRGTTNNCTTTQTISLLVNTLPTINATRNPSVICSSGSSTLTATGGVTYTWNPGALVGNTVVVTPTATTIYTVTGTNALGCSNTRTTNVVFAPTPTVNVSASSLTICSTASVNLTANGANTYTWQPGAVVGASIVRTPSVTTIYTVTGRTTAGCSSTNTIEITTTPGISVTANASPTIICRGQASTLTANGGLTYTWSPGNLNGDNVVVTPTVSTTYTVTGEDLGCTSTRTLLVTVSVPNVTAARNPTAICVGGTSTLTAGGATTYTWMPGSIVGTPVSVSPTVTTQYTVTGTNAIGCTNTRTVNVLVNPIPTVNTSISTATLCAGSSTTLSASGANTYTWNPGPIVGASLTITPSVNTTYTVTGRTTAGCINTNTVEITIETAPSLTASAVNSVICVGNTNTLSVLGASNYTWMPGNLSGSTVTVNPIAYTIYSVSGTSALGCIGTSTIDFSISTITINTTSSPNDLCSSSTATLNATGADTYTWMPGSLNGSSVTISPTVTTTYTVDGTNADGCIGTQTLNIVVGIAPTLTTSVNNASICAGNSVTLTSNGANTYTWMPGSLTTNTVNATPSATTIYTVIGQSIEGCSTTNTIEVNVSPSPTVTAVSNPTILCSNNTATLTANGADSYTWNPGGFNGSVITVSPTLPTVYTISATTLLGCVGSATLDLKVSPTPTIGVSSSSPTTCVNSPVTLTGNGAFTYTWNPGSIVGTTVSVSPSVTTTYSLSGNNGLGCISSETITIDVIPSSIVTASVSDSPICPSFSTSLSASGADTYTWNPGNISGNSVIVNPATTTIYTVSATNSVGCISTETISVDVTPVQTLTLSSSSSSLCGSGTVTLSAIGATNYTWMPSGEITSTIVSSPNVTTTYTVTGDNGLACNDVQFITVTVNPIPSFTLTPSLTGTICSGTSISIDALGATNYTWEPGTITSNSIITTPTITTTYTVTGEDAIGCSVTETITVDVSATVPIIATATPTSGCINSTFTLSASGSSNYTWTPDGDLGSDIVVTPTITTTYTVVANNGLCVSSETVEIIINQNPDNVSATVSSDITCATPTISLNGSSTTLGVNYTWSGPNSYTSTVQNPNDVTTIGDYTLIISDATTGCETSTVVTVTENINLPDLVFSSSGDLGCNASVLLTASSTSTNSLTYLWSGPLSFTTNNQNTLVNTPGDYTISLTDNNSSCVSIGTITVISNTLAPTISATITPATCTGTISNNDGTILIDGFSGTDKYDLVEASTYTGTVDYSSATAVPSDGIITTTLVNPTSPTEYTIRFFGSNGCFKDTTLTLIPTNCIPTNVVGLTKAASLPTYSNNVYQVTYTIIATNPTSVDYTNFSINDNLNNTIPLPATYTVVGQPTITSIGSNLSINTLFDGSTDINLLNSSLSVLSANKSDTIVFNIQINPNALFITFNNSAFCSGTDDLGIAVSDSSEVGFDWDPDLDGNPSNNNTPTPINLIPNSTLGITKTGTISNPLDDKSFDITYAITAHNLGNDTISNLQLTDSITINSPAQFSIKSGPTTSAGLTANTIYNGSTNIFLLNGTDKLAPGAIATVTIVVNIKPDTVTSISNYAIGFGNGTTGISVRDTSNNGSNPDPNGNGNANESGENNPTIIAIPDTELFIPDVFTPNGDGKNDFFVLKGIQGRVVKLTVFNRWGNKVYENSAYDNTWDGTPNASGTLGNSKLPQSTYYYIIEFEDGKTKTSTGYIVIQY